MTVIRSPPSAPSSSPASEHPRPVVVEHPRPAHVDWRRRRGVGDPQLPGRHRAASRGGGRRGRLGRVHQLGADLLLRAALDEQARSREQPLLRLRAPTCLGLPTHGALYRNLGAVRAAEAGSTVNWTELFMSIHSCSIHIHSRCLVKYLGVW